MTAVRDSLELDQDVDVDSVGHEVRRPSRGVVVAAAGGLAIATMVLTFGAFLATAPAATATSGWSTNTVGWMAIGLAVAAAALSGFVLRRAIRN